MKTMLAALSTLIFGLIFIILFVFAGSFVAEFSNQYFESSYAYAILIFNFGFFTVLMVSMLYAMRTLEKYIG